MRTFRRDPRSSGQFLLSAVASFCDETVWTVWRFGTANVPPCHQRKRPSRYTASSHTGYEFRFVRLESSDEMPVDVFRQLKVQTEGVKFPPNHGTSSD